MSLFSIPFIKSFISVLAVGLPIYVLTLGITGIVHYRRKNIRKNIVVFPTFSFFFFECVALAVQELVRYGHLGLFQ